MGGCHLRAAYSLGSVSAWFDASADFLINYSPFHFDGDVRVCVGVQYDIDGWFFHHHCSVEVAAELHLWGPPLPGKIRLEFWVMSIDISFGESKAVLSPATLLEFYRMAQPITDGSNEWRTSYQRPKNGAHIFLVESGLIPAANSPAERSSPTEMWDVRGGSFSFSVNCAMAVTEVQLEAGNGIDPITKKFEDEENKVFLKPMKMDRPVQSSKLVLKITRQDPNARNRVVDWQGWQVVALLKAAPSGLWGKYDAKEDPSGAKSDVAHLLNDKSGSCKLVMGVRLTAPPPVRPTDEPLKFRAKQLGVNDIRSDRGFPLCERVRRSLPRPASFSRVELARDWAKAFDWEIDESWLGSFTEDSGHPSTESVEDSIFNPLTYSDLDTAYSESGWNKEIWEMTSWEQLSEESFSTSTESM